MTVRMPAVRAFCKRRRHFWPRRVDHADQCRQRPDPIPAQRHRRHPAARRDLVGHAQDTQGILGHEVVGGQDRMRLASSSGTPLIVHALVGAAQVQHHIGRAFDRTAYQSRWRSSWKGESILGRGLLDLMDGDHALARRNRKALPARAGRPSSAPAKVAPALAAATIKAPSVGSPIMR